jgi:Tol biopolymer transport system component
MRRCLIVLTLLLVACAEVPTAAPTTTPTPDPTETPTLTPSITPTSATGFTGRIVFDDFEDIYVAQADGSGATRLTTTPGPEFDAEWSPDGTRIVYRDSTRGFNENDEIHIMNADGSGQTNLTNDPANDWGPTWSPDGTQIAFNSMRSGTMRLYTMNPDGSDVREVDTDIWVEYADWSPDGTKFVCECRPPGSNDYEVYVFNADGSDPQRLTTSPGHDGFPVWSPDGTLIAFASDRDDCRFNDAPDCIRAGRDGPHSDVWIMNADGSDQRRLTETFGQFLAWTPDGAYIVFGSLDGLHIVTPDGSEDRRVQIEGIIGDPTLLHWIP